MKRIVINQYGTREIEQVRTFMLELPDDVDPVCLDEGQLEALVDEAGVGWQETGDCESHPDWHEINVEEMADYQYEECPLVKWPATDKLTYHDWRTEGL